MSKRIAQADEFEISLGDTFEDGDIITPEEQQQVSEDGATISIDIPVDISVDALLDNIDVLLSDEDPEVPGEAPTPPGTIEVVDEPGEGAETKEVEDVSEPEDSIDEDADNAGEDGDYPFKDEGVEEVTLETEEVDEEKKESSKCASEISFGDTVTHKGSSGTWLVADTSGDKYTIESTATSETRKVSPDNLTKVSAKHSVGDIFNDSDGELVITNVLDGEAPVYTMEAIDEDFEADYSEEEVDLMKKVANKEAQLDVGPGVGDRFTVADVEFVVTFFNGFILEAEVID